MCLDLNSKEENLFYLKKGFLAKKSIRCKKCRALFILENNRSLKKIQVQYKKVKHINPRCKCNTIRYFFNKDSNISKKMDKKQVVEILNSNISNIKQDLKAVIDQYIMKKREAGILDTFDIPVIELSSEHNALEGQGKYYIYKNNNRICLFPCLKEIEIYINDNTQIPLPYKWEELIKLVSEDIEIIQIDIDKIDNICVYTILNKVKKIIFTVEGKAGYYECSDWYYTNQNKYSESLDGFEEIIRSMLPEKFDDRISALTSNLSQGDPKSFSYVLDCIQTQVNKNKELIQTVLESEDNLALLEQIESLAELRALNLLTEEEFDEKKKKLLDAVQ